jgi:hypothetical protein
MEENGAIPVWPVANYRSRDMLIFAVPDTGKRTARRIWQTHTAAFIPHQPAQTGSCLCCHAGDTRAAVV